MTSNDFRFVPKIAKEKQNSIHKISELSDVCRKIFVQKSVTVKSKLACVVL